MARTANYIAADQRSSKEPKFVVRYHDGVEWQNFCTDDETEIESGTRYNNTIKKVSGAGQDIKPIKSLSSIGGSNISLVDINGIITDYFKSQIDLDLSISGDEFEVYKGYKGLAWTDYYQLFTQNIKGIKYPEGEVLLSTEDKQRLSKKDVFVLASTNAFAPNAGPNEIITIDQSYIKVYDAGNFTDEFDTCVHEASYSDATSLTVGYIRILTKGSFEIARWTDKRTTIEAKTGTDISFSGNTITSTTTDLSVYRDKERIDITGSTTNNGKYIVNGTPTSTSIVVEESLVTATAGAGVTVTAPLQFSNLTRGVLGTRATQHEVDFTADNDKKLVIEEYVYIELPLPALAQAMHTGTPDLPDNWQLGLSSSTDVEVSQFQNIGLDIWDPADYTKGTIFRFEGLRVTDAKKFMAEQVLFPILCFFPVLENGKLGLKRLTGVLSDAHFVEILDDSNIVEYGTPFHDTEQIYNVIHVFWNWDDVKGEYTRDNAFVDQDSIDEFKIRRVLVVKLRGLHGSVSTVSTINRIFNAVLDRYSSPPILRTVTVSSRLSHLKTGDVIKMLNPLEKDPTSTSGTSDRAWEIQANSFDHFSGRLSFKLFASSQQKVSRPPITISPVDGTIFNARYDTNINADSGRGDLVPIATQGSPTVSGGFLLLAPNPNKWVSYDAVLNADMGLVGSVRIKFRTTYSGIPANSQMFFQLFGGTNGQADNIRIEHIEVSGRLDVIMFNNTFGSIKVNIQGTWLAVSGKLHEMELNFDWNTGVQSTWFFIDGIQFQATAKTDPGEIRGNNNDRIDIGRGGAGTNNEFDVDDMSILNTVSHREDYKVGEEVSLYLKNGFYQTGLLAANKLDNDVSTGLTTTLIGDTLHVTGGATLTGNVNALDNSAIYWWDGKFQIDEGVIVKWTNNIQFRIRDSFVNNGTLDGEGAGTVGATAAQTAGTPGYLGTTKAGGGMNLQQSSPSVEMDVAVGSVSTIPRIILTHDGDNIFGMPPNLMGTGGGTGGDIFDFGLKASGGTAGDGGGGILIITRLFSGGASSKIITSAISGGVGSSYKKRILGITYYGGGGSPGAAGGLVIILDGALATSTDENLVAEQPGVDMIGTPWSQRTGGGSLTGGLVVSSDFRGFGPKSSPLSNFKVIFLDANIAATDYEASDTSTAPPTAITITKEIDTGNSINSVFLLTSVTPPVSTGNYLGSNIYQRLNGTSSWALIGLAVGTENVRFSVPADGATYNFKAHAVSISTVESQEFIGPVSYVVPTTQESIIGDNNSLVTKTAPSISGGVIFDKAGLRAFDSSGNKVFNVDDSDGSSGMGDATTELSIINNITTGIFSVGRDIFLKGGVAYPNILNLIQGRLIDFQMDLSVSAGSTENKSGGIYTFENITSGTGVDKSQLVYQSSKINYTWDETRLFKTVAIPLVGAALGDVSIYVGESSGVNNHIGFRFDNDGNLYAIYGKTGTATEVSIRPYSDNLFYILEIKYTLTQILFIVNNLLEHTATVDLPSEVTGANNIVTLELNKTSAATSGFSIKVEDITFHQDSSLSKKVNSLTDILGITTYPADINENKSVLANTDALVITENSAIVNAETNVNTIVDSLIITENGATIT